MAEQRARLSNLLCSPPSVKIVCFRPLSDHGTLAMQPHVASSAEDGRASLNANEALMFSLLRPTTPAQHAYRMRVYFVYQVLLDRVACGWAGFHAHSIISDPFSPF